MQNNSKPLKAKAQNQNQNLGEHLLSLRTGTLELYANSLKQLFLQLQMLKRTYLIVRFTSGWFFCRFVNKKTCRFNANIFSSCWRHKPGYIFFLELERNEKKLYRLLPSKYFLHMGIILTISKVFTIVFLLRLWEQEYPGAVQNKSVSSSFK